MEKEQKDLSLASSKILNIYQLNVKGYRNLIVDNGCILISLLSMSMISWKWELEVGLECWKVES